MRLTFNGGTLISTADVTTARAIAFNGGGTFQPAADTTLTLNGAISGTGDLVMNDVGTLVLAAANTYTGNTVVNAGTLALTGAGTLGDGTGDLVVRAGTTVDLGGTSQSVADLDLHTAQLLGGSGSTATVAQGHGFYVEGLVTSTSSSPAARTVEAGRQLPRSLGGQHVHRHDHHRWWFHQQHPPGEQSGAPELDAPLRRSAASAAVSFQGLTAATFGGLSGDRTWPWSTTPRPAWR